jgi:glucose 1-dehydrogenase
MAERWRIEPGYAVRVDRTSGIWACCWNRPPSSPSRRTFWDPHTVLVVGAVPIGLLAALIGVQQGADVHVLDRVTSGPKPALARQLGAT